MIGLPEGSNKESKALNLLACTEYTQFETFSRQKIDGKEHQTPDSSFGLPAQLKKRQYDSNVQMAKGYKNSRRLAHSLGSGKSLRHGHALNMSNVDVSGSCGDW